VTSPNSSAGWSGNRSKSLPIDARVRPEKSEVERLLADTGAGAKAFWVGSLKISLEDGLRLDHRLAASTFGKGIAPVVYAI